MTKKKRKKQAEWGWEPPSGVLLIACFGGACGAYSAKVIVDAVTNSGSITINWLPAWRADMGVVCIGVGASVVTIFLLQRLANEPQRVVYRSCLLWLPLVLVTALATIVHIPVFAVLLAGVGYGVWAYHRMQTIH